MPITPSLPVAYDPQRGDKSFSEWCENAGKQDRAFRLLLEKAGTNPLFSPVMRAVFADSPYLSHMAMMEAEFTCRMATEPVEGLLNEIFDDVRKRIAEDGSKDSVMRTLRQGKRRIALLVAGADLACCWEVEKVTAALSDYADFAVETALEHLLCKAGERGELDESVRPPYAPSSGLTIIGMGKLGARELNYSSDIDLIVLYDQDRHIYRGRRHPTDFYSRLVRDLVAMLQNRTGDGYVFRTDLRLRPDPGISPLAISFEAAENYYETLGQNWERAAMIKARPIAGDIAAGEAFLDYLKPFIWRKYLDFAAIEDIHSIKRQINSHHGHEKIAVAGHNLKIGRGGIREIEFFAQTQQLIAGGRDPGLRKRATCDAIRALATSHRTEPETAERMINAYRFLRMLEHRLQMINDEQTQTLPTDEADLLRLANFAGFRDLESFNTRCLEVFNTVSSIYGTLFEEAPDLSAPEGNLVFTGTDDDPETLHVLERMGFGNASLASRLIRNWHHGRYRATRSARAREILTKLIPAILDAFAKTGNADDALARFDRFLAALPAGIQLFSLFLNNPKLLGFLANIMATAPRLADYLARHPALFDGIISHDFLDPLPAFAMLAKELDDQLTASRDYQETLDICRRWKQEKHFQIGIQTLENMVFSDSIGKNLSDVADAALNQLLPRVWEEFACRHGHIEGGAMAILAMGKLGSREMSFNSDLDLIFIYDFPAGCTGSDGKKPLAPSTYFTRLGQRLISAIASQTAEGSLYEVDMRLRPSGNAGPLAVPLEGFIQYQKNQAWTWEHMALTRARVSSGPDDLRTAIADTITGVLTHPRDDAVLRREVSEMRRRIAREKKPKGFWDMKLSRGGILDMEFICQYLQLRHAASAPAILAGTTADAFRSLQKKDLIDHEMAQSLLDAWEFQRNIADRIHLCLSNGQDSESIPPGLDRLLSEACSAPSLDSVIDSLKNHRRHVIEHYRALLETEA